MKFNVAVLLVSLAVCQSSVFAQQKPVPIAPAEKLAEGWEEIDQRLIFLMVRLANVETSLEAVEKTIGSGTRKKSVKTGEAKRADRENEAMDRKGGGAMRWFDFYGTKSLGYASLCHPGSLLPTYSWTTSATAIALLEGGSPL